MRIIVRIVVISCALFIAGCTKGERVTPLMKTAHSGNITELEQLIANGAKIDKKSRYGYTALMFAAQEGHDQAVEMLLDAGADPNIVSGDVPSPFETVAGYPPMTVLAIAIDTHHLSIANTLVDRGASIDPVSVALAGREGDIPLLEKLVQKGADLNLPGDPFWPSPLCLAAENGKLEAVQWLIRKGADPNLIAYEHTALKGAVEGDDPEVVRYLLENGADPSIVYDSTHRTALYTAATKYTYRRNRANNLAIIKTLLSHGADRTFRAFGGQKTALKTIKTQRANTLKYLKAAKDPETRERYLDTLAHMDAIIRLLEK